MTLDKAIELLREFDIDRWFKLEQDKTEAIKLGIKAMERLEWLRSRQVIFRDELLEGETE